MPSAATRLAEREQEFVVPASSLLAETLEILLLRALVPPLRSAQNPRKILPAIDSRRLPVHSRRATSPPTLSLSLSSSSTSRARAALGGWAVEAPCVERMGIAPQLPEQRTAAATKRSALVGIAVEGLKRRTSTAATGLVGLVRITLKRLERRAAAATGRAHLLLEIAAAAATRRAEQMEIAPKRPEWMTTTVAVAHRAVERMAGLASLPVIATYQLEPTAATVTRRG